MKALLEIEGLEKRYPGFRLFIEELKVEAGGITALLGPNGAGKTTTINIVMGLVRPERGAVRVFGKDPFKEGKKVKRELVYVPENCHLYDEARAGWLLRFASRFYPGWDESLARQLAQKWSVPLEKKVGHLSKGTKVKLELLMALAAKPRLMILDEPTSGLDPIMRREILQELFSVIEREENSILFSSHIIQDVERVADRVVFLKEGRIVLNRDKEELLESWRRLRLKGEGELEGLPAVAWRREQDLWLAVFSEFGPQVREALSRRGFEVLEAERMSLEEIFFSCIKEEVSP